MMNDIGLKLIWNKTGKMCQRNIKKIVVWNIDLFSVKLNQIKYPKRTVCTKEKINLYFFYYHNPM